MKPKLIYNIEKPEPILNKYDILVCTVASYTKPPFGFQVLQKSCLKHHINLTIIGEDKPWLDFFYNKISLLYTYLKSLKTKPSYVIALDAVDTICLTDIEEIFEKILTMKHQIILSGSDFLWPPVIEPSQYTVSPNIQTRFINSGLYVGKYNALLDALEKPYHQPEVFRNFQQNFASQWARDDQAIWHVLFLKQLADIGIDYNNELFYNFDPKDMKSQINHNNKEWVLLNQRITIHSTNAQPCFIHFPSWLKERIPSFNKYLNLGVGTV
jgi:hypothetical protein